MFGSIVQPRPAAAASALAQLRADPARLADLEIGRWFEAPLRRRALLRLLAWLPALAVAPAARVGGRAGKLAAQGAFWGGVRRAATDSEWRRLTHSSYVALYYHRLAGEGKPGQERLDLPPGLFAKQIRLLQRLRFRPLGPEQLIAFHQGSLPELPRRSYVVTADDGFLDCVEPFLAHASIRPQLYVPSAEVGGRSWWAGDEPIAGWDDLRRLAAAGVGVGSHAHRHVTLPDLDDAQLREELTSSRRELAERLPASIPVVAYPHGRRDERVAAAAAAAGFRLAFTTDPGRNGAGTAPLHLRRIGIKAWDSRLSFLWKVITGELLPARWEARRIRRARPSSHRLRSTGAPPGA